MDFGDLQEYGFDTKSGSCGGNTCINRKNIKSLDDVINKGVKFTNKFLDQSA